MFLYNKLLILKYNINVIITLISMRGGEFMWRVIDFILDVVVQR